MSSTYYSTAEARLYAKENLFETDDTREKSIQKIQEWIINNPHLRAKKDDKTILAFLRGCKFNIEKTKQKIINFYVMKSERPEWFRNRDPMLPEIQELVRLGVFVPLKKYYDNKLVVIIKTAAHDPRKHKQDDVFKVGKMILDIAIMEHFENTTIYGVTVIFDMKNVTFSHALQLPPNVIKKAVYAWQNYYCRQKNLEFVNAPMYVNVVLNIFKGFMSAKMKSRVRVHFTGVDSACKFIPKHILPPEYGGTGDSMQDLIHHWDCKLQEYRRWFKEDEKYKADLRKI